MTIRRISEPSVTAIIGTRPEAIKIAPVLRALAARGIAHRLVLTGQHRDLDLASVGLDGSSAIGLNLDVVGIDADTMCARVEMLARARMESDRPSLVLVQGDTNSALGAARAAKWLGIAVGHVEAGLRTFDRDDPWPEERNRVEIDGLADLLFAPTPAACDNLRSERVSGKIILSGNTGIDALLRNLTQLATPAIPSTTATLLVTVHRRENRGAGVRAVAEAMRRISRQEDVSWTIPLHLNAQARSEMIVATAGIPRLRLLEAQDSRAMIALMLRSRLILTDSGGLQEEAPALGRPLLILRRTTERPEAIASGNALLVGIDPDRIVAETLRLLRDDDAYARMSTPAFPFGTGKASEAIATEIQTFLGHPDSPAPLDRPRHPA